MVLITVFAEPFFGKVDEFAQGTSYENDISIYFEEDDGVNPLRVLFYAVPPVAAFAYQEKLSKYYEKNACAFFVRKLICVYGISLSCRYGYQRYLYR